MCKSKTIRFLILVSLCLGSVTAQAVSARKLIQQGNAAYQSGKFEDALSAYDEASVDAPESPEIYYNRGAVFYRQEDYEQAKAAFEKAALKSVEPDLESRARYNLGNCAFREAERQRDSDLQKSFESCEDAIKHYQDALRRNKDLTKAAENIEIVRLYMKALLDEIEKQKQEQEQQQQQQEDLAQKLKELIERQAKALAESKQLVAQARQPNSAQQQQELALGMEDLTKEQGSIQTDSEAVSKAVLDTINQHAQAAQPPMPGATNQAPGAAQPPQQLGDKMLEKFGLVKEHVDNAIGQQTEANRKLPLQQIQQAQPHQQASEEELKKALEALQEEDQQQQQQQQQQDQGDEDEEGEENKDEQQQQEQQQGEQGEQQQGEEKKEQQEQEMQAAKAEDILNEEKDQREERRRQIPVRFRAVDKNW